jgi:hypothetical protein
MSVPILVNSIGSAVFFDLIGTIYLRQEQIEVIERPGVDGSGARKSGARGKPFQLLAVSYHDSWSAFHTAMTAFKAYPGTDPQTLTRNGESYGSFLVLDVMEARPPQAVLNVAGSPSSQVRAETAWTLLG